MPYNQQQLAKRPIYPCCNEYEMPDSKAALNGKINLVCYKFNLLIVGIVTEIFGILRPRGICAFSTWQAAGWVLDIRAALATISGVPRNKI